MKKIIALSILLSSPLLAANYVDNGDGTVTQIGITMIVDPKSIVLQITNLQNQQVASNAKYQSQIDALTQQLTAINVQVPGSPLPPLKVQGVVVSMQ